MLGQGSGGCTTAKRPDNATVRRPRVGSLLLVPSGLLAIASATPQPVLVSFIASKTESVGNPQPTTLTETILLLCPPQLIPLSFIAKEAEHVTSARTPHYNFLVYFFYHFHNFVRNPPQLIPLSFIAKEAEHVTSARTPHYNFLVYFFYHFHNFVRNPPQLIPLSFIAKEAEHVTSARTPHYNFLVYFFYHFHNFVRNPPQLIPLSFIAKEAEHVEGFAPELALVTKGGLAWVSHVWVNSTWSGSGLEPLRPRWRWGTRVGAWVSVAWISHVWVNATWYGLDLGPLRPSWRW